LVISICGVICGAEHWNELEEFGDAKQEWFASFLELENGIPSHDIPILIKMIKSHELEDKNFQF